MFSRYLRTRQKAEAVAVFHQLHPVPVFCSLADWEQIAAGQQEHTVLLDRLKELKLIVDDATQDDAEWERTNAQLMRKLNQPTILYLMTAQGCNFNCAYCPVPDLAKLYGESVLSDRDAIAGIDLWREHVRDVYDPVQKYFVIFYGGEPLLNTRVIKRSLQYLQQQREQNRLPAHLQLMIATNGSLLDDEMLSLCKEHHIIVVVGLDGPQASNDLLRIDRDGLGTHDRIQGAISQLLARGIRTCASVSITPANLDDIQDYSTLFEDIGIEQFGFNFLKGKELLKLVGADGLAAYYRKASRGVIENARRGKPGFEYQMLKKRTAFEQQDFFPVDCTCYGNQLVIQPDGEISHCPFYKARLGQVQQVPQTFRIWDQPIVQEWRKRLPLYHSEFADYDSMAICGGGCAWSCGELKGDHIAVDDSSRIFSEEVLDELLWSQFAGL